MSPLYAIALACVVMGAVLVVLAACAWIAERANRGRRPFDE